MKQQFPSAHPSSACAVDPTGVYNPSYLFRPFSIYSYTLRPHHPKSAITFFGVSTGHLTLFFDSVRLYVERADRKRRTV